MAIAMARTTEPALVFTRKRSVNSACIHGSLCLLWVLLCDQGLYLLVSEVNATITVLIIFLFSLEERVCQTEAIWRNSLTNDAISNYSSRPATTDHH